MVIVMEDNATERQIENVIKRVEELGFEPHLSQGDVKTIIGVIGENKYEAMESIASLRGIEKVVEITKPYKLSGKQFKKEPTVVDVDGVKVGGESVTVMAGPCAVESKEQLFEAAEVVKENGAQILRGGAYKPRTSPYSFQGLKEKGLKFLAEARERTGLKIVTEVMDTRSVELVAKYADIFQIGARNMQNYPLLREVGKADKPVLLKRGMTATYKELLLSAEYVMAGGNHDVILCERGIRTFSEYTRNTVDISTIPVIKELSHLPIIVDPSHGTGKWSLVDSVSKGAIAAGADGLLIEVHPDPATALSDGPQSLTPTNFAKLMDEMQPIAEAVNKKL
ncbi:3-deoxy-7-phosphoheptulonate synthase [Acetohalobium arabaticum]|uniref:3-deoxy-D-arabinoheptulosonate-7-phosphate synthase n=1 Tax=Acetohalobium arabaticum (strain ATCC 49924 / DSM 5501 / Z-7288) TaxID=574087 RepID=D9QPW4_ACEAZ|nr:3-deoxy-7-phosphoheptulonate synthase [Acetohalobium arabaticum]ADL12555.1 3-deoxy-D-arabinoheptulosonate-7-phosphate synthase [Acetohalobium arabaticum DSM 5501]